MQKNNYINFIRVIVISFLSAIIISTSVYAFAAEPVKVETNREKNVKPPLIQEFFNFVISPSDETFLTFENKVDEYFNEYDKVEEESKLIYIVNSLVLLSKYTSEFMNEYGTRISDEYKKKILLVERKIYKFLVDKTEVGLYMHNFAVTYNAPPEFSKFIDQDYEKFMFWTEKAAEKQEPRAMFNLGVRYLSGVEGYLEKNQEKGVKILQQAIEITENSEDPQLIFINVTLKEMLK